MIAGFPPLVGSKEERRLLALFKSLNDGDKQTLVKFAEFLNHSNTVQEQADLNLSDQPIAGVPTPDIIERPAQESVIKAIKRLGKSYSMVDKSTLLDKISGLMTEHLIKGRDAVSVIDELEEIFRLAYEDLL